MTEDLGEINGISFRVHQRDGYWIHKGMQAIFETPDGTKYPITVKSRYLKDGWIRIKAK